MDNELHYHMCVIYYWTILPSTIPESYRPKIQLLTGAYQYSPNNNNSLNQIWFSCSESSRQSIIRRHQCHATFIWRKKLSLKKNLDCYSQSCLLQACNECVLQVVNLDLPFGGVGHSGYGKFNNSPQLEAQFKINNSRKDLRPRSRPARSKLPFVLLSNLKQILLEHQPRNTEENMLVEPICTIGYFHRNHPKNTNRLFGVKNYLNFSSWGNNEKTCYIWRSAYGAKGHSRRGLSTGYMF